MLSSFKEIKNVFIFENEGDSYPIGILVDFVINPETGRLEALWVKTGQGLRLLDPKDILKWTTQKIVIPSENDLSEANRAPKLQKIMDREVQIIRAKVFTKKEKKYIGYVEDFSFDTISPKILSIIVRGGLWGMGTARIIPHSKIDKITEEGIFILENEIKTSEKIEDPLIDLEKPKVPETEGPR